MDVTNRSCTIEVQNNVNTSITNIVQSTLSSGNILNQDYHLIKTVKSFRGRDDELEQLSSWLFQDKKNMAVICGLPGYGKTELARRFAHHCKERELVKSVLWLDAETTSILEQSLRNLLRWVGARDKAELDVRSVVQAVHQHFSTETNLFVLDNALDRRNVLGFEPEGRCFCILTSHLEDWGDDVPPLQLTPLSLDAAVDVLRAELQHRFHDEDLEQYKHLAEVLSCVPLALQIAAAYVRQESNDLDSDFCLGDYVDRLQVPSTEVIDQPLPDFSANTYDKTFLQAIQISLHKIQKCSNYDFKLATDILYICAYLNPEQIFYSTLLEIPCLKRILKNNPNPKKYLKKACALLCKYSFTSIENDKILIHRLIQEILCLISKDKIFFSCLEILLDNSKIFDIHSDRILKYAEHSLEIFDKFYTKYKLTILNKNDFIWRIIQSNCNIFLMQILDGLGDSAADVVNRLCLLHWAVWCQQHGITELLLEKYKPYVDQKDKNKDTALIVAARKLDLCAMKTFALHNADVNSVDAYGDSVLHEVIRASGKAQHFGRSLEAIEAVQWLVERGARTAALGRFDMSLVHTACESLSPDLVRCLVQDFGCDVNALHMYKQTPLYYVVSSPRIDRCRQQDTVRCLLELGARLDIKDVWGRTPAEHARANGQKDLAIFIENPSVDMQESDPIVYELLGAVAHGDVLTLTRLLNDLGERALNISNEACLLYEAVSHNTYDVLELLLAHGVDVDCRANDKSTPLHYATWRLDLRAMKLLVDHGADVNAVNVSGRSILHNLVHGLGEVKRARRGDEACEAVRWLVKHGACTDALTSQSSSLLHDAAYSLSPDLVRCLVTEYNLDVNSVDITGWSPLFCVSDGLLFWRADESRGLSTAACLLELGARVHVLDRQNKTPAEVARRKGHAQLAAFLDTAAVKDDVPVQDFERHETDIVTSVTEDDVQIQYNKRHEMVIATTAIENDIQVQISEREEVQTVAAAAVEDDVQMQLRRAAAATVAAALAAIFAWKFVRY